MDPTTGLARTEHHPPDGTDGPLVVLVHGSLDRASSFDRVLRRLDDLHTLTYDRRGYARSRDAQPARWTIDGHVDDLLALVDGRPCVLVGVSYGGDVALGAALRGEGAPVLAVAAFEPPMPWLGAWSQRRLPPGADARPIHGDGPSEAAERFFRRMVGDAAWERLPERTKQERRADGPALRAELADLRRPAPPFDVTDLAVPSVFGRGERTAPHHHAVVGWLSEHVPGAELVEVAGAGHGAHLTHPDAFAAFVRTAVARATGRQERERCGR